MTLFIGKPITPSRINPIAARRDDGFNTFFSERLNKSIAITTFIAQQGADVLRPQSQQTLSLSDLVGLPTCQNKIQWIAQCICTGMNSSGKTALGSPQGFCFCFYLSRTARCSSSTGMRSGNRAINQNLLHVWILTATCRQKFPDLLFAPTRKTFKTEFHLPNDSGNKRHCAPLRKIHSIAFKKRRNVSIFPT